MTLRFRRSMLLIPTTLLAAFLTGCGGNNISTPSSPSPPPVASFAGTWSGTYTASNCGHTGDWPSGLCEELSGALPVTLTLTQTGSSVTVR
jgi:hypothetical protein